MTKVIEASPAEKNEASCRPAEPVATKHTPGPWCLNEFTKDSIYALWPNSDVRIALATTISFDSATREANCRLMAAAPTMFEALMQIAESHVPDQPAEQNYSEAAWAQRHVGELRRKAREALKAHGLW